MLLLTVVILSATMVVVDSLATVSAPGIVGRLFSPQTLEREQTSQSTSAITSLRIRSTRPSDIEAVSAMLASELLQERPSTEKFNFKATMEWLKTKSAIEKLLNSRYQAIQQGQITWQKHASELEEYPKSDQIRYLWEQEGVRKKVETAARLSTERHAWQGHNFSLVPEDPSWLQHTMMTAEDATGSVIGFVEIAMLTVPGSDESGKKRAAPAIVNLVTSQQHRRQGIASKLLTSAERFVLQHYPKEETLNLYVEENNLGALQLYLSKGFSRVGSMEMSTGRQWYMTRPLSRRTRDSTSNGDDERAKMPTGSEKTKALDMAAMI